MLRPVVCPSVRPSVCRLSDTYVLWLIEQESPANAKGTHDSSACMKAKCKIRKNLYFSAQGHSRSLLSVSIETSV